MSFFETIGLKNIEFISEIISFNFTNSYLLKLNNKEITCACRPYNIRKECDIPEWCFKFK